MQHRRFATALGLAGSLVAFGLLLVTPASAQSDGPVDISPRRDGDVQSRPLPPPNEADRDDGRVGTRGNEDRSNDRGSNRSGSGDRYEGGRDDERGGGERRDSSRGEDRTERRDHRAPREPEYVPPPPRESYAEDRGTYSVDEIKATGHRFFGKVSLGLARVIEYAFSRAGRPNGYILGEEAGGAIIAGVRYGEGTLFTKTSDERKIYWQGPSVGYDFGAEGSKTMVLVYNLRNPSQIYTSFAGVDGSAYFIGGVGITFQTNADVVLAPIRSGVGLRLGANVGYLKYTRQPTWNPF